MKLFQLIILSTFLTLPALYGAIIKNDVRERSAPKASLGISAKGATLYEQLRDILKSVRSGHLPTDMDHLSDCCSEESNCSMLVKGNQTTGQSSQYNFVTRLAQLNTRQSLAT